MLEIYHTVNKVFSLSVPLQSLFQTPLETILTANPAVNFYLVWALIITSQFPFTSRSRGICFHSAPHFSCYSSGNPWLKGGSPRVITNNPQGWHHKPLWKASDACGKEGRWTQIPKRMVSCEGLWQDSKSSFSFCSVLEFQAKCTFFPVARTCWQMLKSESYSQF